MHRFQQWREALQLAPDIDTVNGIVRDYVEAIRQMLPVLPGECVELLRQQEPNIHAAAVTLLHAELRFKGEEEERALLHEIAHTFASAAVRVTTLHPRPTLSPAAVRVKSRADGAE